MFYAEYMIRNRRSPETEGTEGDKWYGAEYAKTPRRYMWGSKDQEENRQAVGYCEGRMGHQVLLMTTLAPSLPSTPLSFALGLRSRPFLRLRKPSMPDGLSALGFCTSEEL